MSKKKNIQTLEDLMISMSTKKDDEGNIKPPSQRQFVLKSNEHGFKVGDVARFIDRPYRHVYGLIWRKKNNYVSPSERKRKELRLEKGRPAVTRRDSLSVA